ncbi:Protein-glutamate O-methyltransferase [Sulfidibacter corallicola]|uniref:protein-glutamate O-methyltransferase n=1 Tax=Sulfidibacter corallicola TaxID=2818388 RepID=A0A8A4TE75_SULCO|nr:protein-glutamate O-methyltransferase CheR [Sulfidibacter corallicola]QTD47524.1 protein-glutamate O-methyltransferase CheR [Sulfidibacter corallicola]
MNEFRLDGMMEIQDAEFKLFQDLIYNNFGIHLTEAKRSLLVRRLQQVIRQGKFKSFRDYYNYLCTHPSDRNLTELVNRITTNYTFFNREADHFDLFYKTCLPEIVRRHTGRNSRDLRVWCAAASTGEEPYMLAMLIMEFFGGQYGMWDAGVLATDISQQALEKARRGRYTEEQVKTLPPVLFKKYFQKSTMGQYEVIDRLRREITYRRFNLINRLYPFKKPFDVVFCRNVMIYFDQPTKDHVVRKIHESLAPGGYLFIGHSESLARNTQGFQYLQPAAYRKI